ncbi:MAG: hypothetical protein HY072_10025 [Deltaproteobacteria bacterium]|nr:hypothetical protein [Deltaproteobacteria bacterium]
MEIIKKALFLLLFIGLGSTVFAQTKKLEVYPAIEADEAKTEETVLSKNSILNSSNSSFDSMSKKSFDSMSKKSFDSVSLKSFDLVSNDQVDSIANRLKIVETLIRNFKRAYDYRILTTKELELIVKNLQKNKLLQNKIVSTPEPEDVHADQTNSLAPMPPPAQE